MDQVLLVVLCNLGRPSMQHPWPAQVKQEPRRTSPQSREHHLLTEPDPDCFPGVLFLSCHREEEDFMKAIWIRCCLWVVFSALRSSVP